MIPDPFFARRFAGVAMILAAAIAIARAQSPVPPPWAYTVNPPPPPASPREDSSELRRDRAGAASGREGGPGVKPAAPDPVPRTIPESAVSLTVAQTRDAYNPPDWFPDAHPPMPPSVAHGRRPELRA